MKVRVTMQGSRYMTKSQAMGNMAEAAGKYFELVKHPSSAPEFGKSIGNVMKQLLGSVLSQKYFVDETGRLRKQLSSSMGESFYAALLVLSMALLVLGAVAVRARRGVNPQRAYLDVEAGRSRDQDWRDTQTVCIE